MGLPKEAILSNTTGVDDVITSPGTGERVHIGILDSDRFLVGPLRACPERIGPFREALVDVKKSSEDIAARSAATFLQNGKICI